MVVLGIGVDLVHLPRIAKLVAGKHGGRFPARILSGAELKDFKMLGEDQERRVRYLAVRWAAKEAAYKALYPSIRPSWKDLALLRLPSDVKPRLELVSSSHAVDLQVSISHDGDYVVASVLAQKS